MNPVVAPEDVLRSFYCDPASLHNVLAASSAGSLATVGAFIRRVAAYGIVRSHVDVEDFDIFRHEGLARAVEEFIRENPLVSLPLERITVSRYASAGACREDLAATLSELAAHRERMAHYAVRFNVDVHVNLFVQGLDAGQAIAIAGVAESEAVDSMAIVFDFSRIDAVSAASLRRELALFCEHDAARNPKITLGNFPFCFVPEAKFKLLYRDALGALKGQIGAQRSLLRELRGRAATYHAPCRECRCRVPCHAYTQVGAFPECASLLVPRRGRTLAFAGGSLAPADRPEDDDIVWAPPAEQGDMLAAVLEGFENLLILDGYFYSRFPCTTFELMLALEAGLNVFGASSIGALRAVELDRFGMTGCGRVYEWLKALEIKPYHVVAQTYDEADRPLSMPLLQIVFLLERAAADGAISGAERDALGALAEGFHFTALSFGNFLRQAGEVPSLADAAGRLDSFYRSKGGDRLDVKRQDALLLLERFRSELANRPRDFVPETLGAARERCLRAVRSRYIGGHDLAVRAGWTGSGQPGAPSGMRDRREVPADETCERARRFFEGLDLVLADTTRYDPAGSFILSAFFLPFYFMDYYPSSATGNGPVFREALASAYMELVERMSACALHVAGVPLNAIPAEPFPTEQLPQFCNWGAEQTVKQAVAAAHGYVAVTDILAGRNVAVPASAVMFRYSGTDGYASGNSPAEAILYGIYELIERDTCQIHLLDPACRRALPQFQIDRGCMTDERSRTLLSQVEDKGCDIALFRLPNLFGLPCVMCHVYDRNRRIQCHGGIAARSDFQAAAHAALHEAYMQYITYFAGTRDDYHSLAPTKRARVAYANAQQMFFSGPVAAVPPAAAATFESVGAELEHVLARVRAAGVGHVLVADLSPRAEYALHCVKVIIPTLELWFCPQYTPSPCFPERVRRTRELF